MSASTNPSAVPDDLREMVEEIASRLDDIHFNSRHGSWIESAKEIIAAALLQARNAEREAAWKDGCAYGFGMSGEGWNAEYPFDGEFATDAKWLNYRDMGFSGLKEGS